MIVTGIGLIFHGFYRTHDFCVRLPNGLVVAYEAYANLGRPYFLPNVVVKGPDGTVFSSGNDDPFYFSETTAYWSDIHGNFGGLEKLAYRPDVGLISSWHDPALRSRLIGEAGELLEEGKTLHNTNVLGVLTYLKDRPEYGSRDCGVPLVTMADSYPD
jgi:hypothetical protein